MLLRHLALVSLLALLTTGCASMNESECRANDMYSKGLSDGEEGEPMSRLADHRKACDEYGIKLDGELYRKGRDDGLKRYCTPGNGEQVGRAGKSYASVCPPELEPAFLKEYKKGKFIHDIEQKQRELDNVREQLRDKDLKPKDRAQLEARRDRLEQDLRLMTIQSVIGQ